MSRTGHLYESSKAVGPWRDKIRTAAFNKFAGHKPTVFPVEMGLEFYFPRPQSHFRTGKYAGEIKDSAPTRHTTKPDLDKLTRAVLDSLTGIVYLDDSQVVKFTHLFKAYEEEATAGVHITVDTHFWEARDE